MDKSNDIHKIDKQLIKSTLQFPVIGIGASAGGLEAFKKLVKAIPPHSGMAYILVQHLSPSHDSVLPELLQRITTIPIHEITDNIRVEPDNIYIIPSNKLLIANDGVLELSARPPKDQRNMPVDIFFSSLAEVHQSYAIGIVLSGTASDGTLGLKAIKDFGGITFAQDEMSAAFDGMPNSAVQAGFVDFVLRPEEIPKKIAELKNRVILTDEDLESLPPEDNEVFKQILSLLRLRKGTDFTYYKQTTIRRRILRRIAINKLETSSAYLNYLREEKNEQDLLYQDLLIPVTYFFRDHPVFDNLCESVFPNIEKFKSDNETFRVWVAGCSTGQEAYSIAMCLKEFLTEATQKRESTELRIQIFATDLSEPAIAKARTGIYTKVEMEGLSPERIEKFFTKADGSYHLIKSIRDMCVFAVHNFLKDPPFAKVDFLSCRNVLIYMEPYLQKKALTSFHYALNQKGYLLLGKSETITSVPELFGNVTKSDKLYIRKDVPGRYMHPSIQKTNKKFGVTNAFNEGENIRADFQKTADDILLRKYTPAGVVVNEFMEIVHFRGNTSDFLEQNEGKPSHNLLKMAKEGLGFELRNILHKAKTEGNSVSKENIPVFIDGTQHDITLEAILLHNIVERHYLILFHNNNSTVNTQSTQEKRKTKIGKEESTTLDKNVHIKRLEEELFHLREDMRSITEDQEAANEELQSANEELLSGSEELQSMNEELETSKEELQSTNEELTVVNQEMISLNEQIREARNYAESIVTTIREPLVVLDRNLRVKTANNAFYKTFRVNELETEGVYIYDLGNRQWNIPELRMLLENILPDKTNFAEVEVTHTFPNIGKRVMRLNACEIQRENNVEKLILLAIEDITERKEAAKKIEENEKHLQNIFLNAPSAICILEGTEQKIILANNAYEKLINRKAADLLGKSNREVFPELIGTGTFELFDKVFATGEPFNAPEYAAMVDLNNEGAPRQCYFNFSVDPLKNDSGKIYAVMVISYDITEQVEARKKIEESEKQQAFLLYFSDTLRTETTVDAAANRALQMLSGHLKLDRCYIGVYQLAEDRGVFPYQIGNERVPPMPASVRLSDFPDALRVAFDRTMVIDDITKAEDLSDTDRQNLGALGMCALVAATLRHGEVNPLWSIVVVSASPRHWTLSEVTLIEEVTERTWAAVERAKAEESLRKSEEKYRTLFDSIDEGFSTVEVLFDEKGKANDYIFLEMNRAHEAMTGIPLSAIGKRGREVLYLEDSLFEILEKVVLTGEPVRYELYISALGKWFNIYTSRVGDSGSRVVTTVFNNITERKQSEEKIAQSEKRYNMMLMQSPFAFAVLKGKDMVVTLANDSIKNMWGKGKDLEGKPLLEVLPEIKDQPFPTLLNEVYTTGIPYSSYESLSQLQRKGKMEDVYFNFVYQPYHEADETISGVVIIATEITPQAILNQKIKESEINFRQLADLIPDKISTADAEGNLNYYNQNWADFTGLNIDKLKNAGWIQSIHADDRDWVSKRWQEAITTGTGLELELRMIDKQGGYKWHLLRALPVRDEQGNLLKWISSMTEIQQQLEQREELEKVVLERTKELITANEQLEEQNNTLHKMNQELESFTYISSHDLQEPLRKIQTFASRIFRTENDHLSEAGKDYLDRMKNAAKRMQILIEDLLEYSHAHINDRKFSKTDLNLIIKEVSVDFDDALLEKSATLEVDSLTKADISPFQFRQVISNLLSNALKFSRPGVPPHIVIKSNIAKGSQLENENPGWTRGILAPEKSYCHISFADNGIGFEPEYKDKIFQVFQRLHDKDEYAGTGIGLAIVRKIVDSHNGHIIATGEPGIGARFDIYLPQQLNS